jgi:hypothetical protein
MDNHFTGSYTLKLRSLSFFGRSISRPICSLHYIRSVYQAAAVTIQLVQGAFSLAKPFQSCFTEKYLGQCMTRSRKV